MTDIHKTTYIIPGSFLKQDTLHHRVSADELRIRVVRSKKFGTYIEHTMILLTADNYDDYTSVTTNHSLESIESALCAVIQEANQHIIISALMEKLNRDWYVNVYEQGEADYVITEELVNQLVKYE